MEEFFKNEEEDMFLNPREELYFTIERSPKTINLSRTMRLLKPEYQNHIARMLLHRIKTGKHPAFKYEPLGALYAYLVIHVLDLEPEEQPVSVPQWRSCLYSLTKFIKKFFTF